MWSVKIVNIWHLTLSIWSQPVGRMPPAKCRILGSPAHPASFAGHHAASSIFASHSIKLCFHSLARYSLTYYLALSLSLSLRSRSRSRSLSFVRSPPSSSLSLVLTLSFSLYLALSVSLSSNDLLWQKKSARWNPDSSLDTFPGGHSPIRRGLICRK